MAGTWWFSKTLICRWLCSGIKCSSGAMVSGIFVICELWILYHSTLWRPWSPHYCCSLCICSIILHPLYSLTSTSSVYLVVFLFIQITLAVWLSLALLMLWSLAACLMYKVTWYSLSLIDHLFVTGSIARSANLPVFNLLRGRFWGFRPAGATRCTDGGEIWHGGGSPPPCQISPHRCNVYLVLERVRC